MSAGTPEQILLDIEGTTTPLDFVHQVLFPYARTHLADFLARHSGSEEVQTDLERLREECDEDIRRGLSPPPADPPGGAGSGGAPIAYALWLMDQDRKSTPLKSIQGKIWEEGYRNGSLKGRVFPDVPRAFNRWTERGIRVFIFSSGSVLAQKLLFEHSDGGDLTRSISGYFDTTTGPKNAEESYRKIASLLNRSTKEFFFLSDAPKELSAASAAGMEALLCVRPGNPAPPPGGSFRVIETFDRWP